MTGYATLCVGTDLINPCPQIYRITLSDSPMPVERYIANFVSEIPLPPPGQIQVQLTLPDRSLIIARPPRNDLPLVDVRALEHFCLP